MGINARKECKVRHFALSLTVEANLEATRNSAVGMEMLKRRVQESMLRSSTDGRFTIKHYFERGFHYKTIVNFEKFPDSREAATRGGYSRKFWIGVCHEGS